MNLHIKVISHLTFLFPKRSCKNIVKIHKFGQNSLCWLDSGCIPATDKFSMYWFSKTFQLLVWVGFTI